MSSIRSAILLFCVLFPAVVYAGTPPTVPGGVVAFGVLPTQINIYWNSSTDAVGVAGYYIYRCTGSTCVLPAQPTYNLPISTLPGGTFTGDLNVNGGTTYCYSIAAYDAAGNISAQSAVVSATTSGSTSNMVPVITFTSPVNGVGYVGQEFDFSMHNSYLTSGGGKIYGNSLYSWTWDFGDGQTSGSASDVGHVYSQPGTYTVTLTTSDNTGASAFTQQTITILPAAISGLVLRLRFNGDIS